MQISAINSFYKSQPIQKSNKLNTNKENKNNFEFSNTSANAIKSYAMAGISFGSKGITLSELRQKERMVNKDSVIVYSYLQGIYYQIAPRCLQETRMLQADIARDLDNIGTDSRVKIEKTIVGDEIKTKSLTRYDDYKMPVYCADFKNGKIETIKTYDMEGMLSKIIKFDSESETVESYQSGFDGKNDKYDFKIIYKQGPTGEIVAHKYLEGHQKDDLGFEYFDKIMTFIDEEKMVYQEGVDRYNPISERAEAITREFNFSNYQTFDYLAGFERGNGKKFSSGEFIAIKDFNLKEWDKGYVMDLDNHRSTQLPRIIIDKNNVIEYDEGYEINDHDNITRHNFISIENGIPMAVLDALGFTQ